MPSDIGYLESLFMQGRGDLVEIYYDSEESCFVATLLKDYDPGDEEDEDALEELGDDELALDEDDDIDEESLSPGSYELVEYGDDDEEPQSLRELVKASGATMVEALLQLELTYRNLLGQGRG